MYRRKILAVSIGLGLAGCLSGGENAQDLALGESTEYQGVQVMVTETKTASEILVNGRKWEPSYSSTYLLLRVHVQNVDDEERTFPGAHGDGVIDAFRLMRGSKTIQHEGPIRKLEVEEQELDYYYFKLHGERDYGASMHPGEEVDGWLVFEVPEDYTSEDTYAEVEWGPEEDTRTTRWILK